MKKVCIEAHSFGTLGSGTYSGDGVVSAFTAFAEPPRDPADLPRKKDASNLGIDSMEFGRQGVRNDVARTPARQGHAFGLNSPGGLYPARVRERGGDEECWQRQAERPTLRPDLGGPVAPGGSGLERLES